MSARLAESPSFFAGASGAGLVAPWQQELPDPVWARTAVQRLTIREREILQLVAAWWTDREIADALFISYRTVTTHLSHIYDKLGVDSRRAAAYTLLLADDPR